MKRKILALIIALFAAATLATGSAIAASAGTNPGPTVSPVPAQIPAATYLPRGVPRVNPFAGCRFSTTNEFTFVRQLGTFATRIVPAIVCIRIVNGVRQVDVYDLVR